MGNLYSPPPLASPVLDATVGTGRFASEHGVLDRLVGTDADPGYRRVQGADWAAPAVWEIVAQRGKRTAAIAWPATYPASAFEGHVLRCVGTRLRGMAV